MVENFIDHPEIHGLIRGTVEENSVGVTFSPQLMSGDEINDDVVLILKIDSYYNTQRMPNPPKSVDYVVIVKCEADDGYDMYIIELRNVGDTSGVKPRDIRKKFETIFSDFFVRFNGEFEYIFAKLKKLKLYLITDPLGLKSKELDEDQIKERIKGTVIETFGFLTPFEFLGKAYLIEVKVPDPVIPTC